MDVTTSDDAKTTHVVIVGAGFAGLHCARQLASSLRVSVTLIDKHNYQQFHPLLYQVATGILSPHNAAFNVREVFLHRKRVAIVMAEIDSADLKALTVRATTGDVYRGDILVLAVGAEANFFSIPGSEQFTFPMYSLQDAERLRSRVLELFEEANTAGGAKRARHLHLLVVGGGATGVEIAGAMADVIRRMPEHLFPNVDFDNVVVSLVDAGKSVLPPFTQASQEYARHILQARGVVLRLGLSVREVTVDDVLLSDGSRIETSLVVWAGGLQASKLSHSLGIDAGKGGRIDVAPDLTLAGYPGVYVLGDFANTTGLDGQPLPQLASVAQQAGRHCANNILAAIAGRARTPFAYVDRGIMAMIGRNAAVAELGANHQPISGVFAFAAWLGVHATLMTSVRARIATLLEWTRDYFGSVNMNPILDRPSHDSASHEEASTSPVAYSSIDNR